MTVDQAGSHWVRHHCHLVGLRLRQPAVEPGEIRLAADVSVNRLGEGPPEPLGPLLGDAPMPCRAPTTPHCWHEPRIAAELLRVREPVHFTYLGDDEEGDADPHAGDDGE